MKTHPASKHLAKKIGNRKKELKIFSSQGELIVVCSSIFL